MARLKSVIFPLLVGLVLGGLGNAMMSGCNAKAGGSGGNEEYKVVHIAGRLDDAQRDKELNDLAKQGWKVRAASWGNGFSFFVLAR